MKYFKKNIYLVFLYINISLISVTVFDNNAKASYSKDDVFNYFSGIVALSQNNTTSGFKYLKKINSLKNVHYNYNIKFLRSLVLLNKFDEAFSFSKEVWDEEILYFDADLLLGLNYFIKKDFINAEKYFSRLNKFSKYNLFLDDFLGNVLLGWVKASKNDMEGALAYHEKIPDRYKKLKKIQNALLQCYFDTPQTATSFEQLIDNQEYSSRYSFFLVNYLIHKNDNTTAKEIIQKGRKEYSSNLLIKQSEDFFKKGEYKKIKKLFDCKNPRDSIAEILYVMANIYSANENYNLSNFYLNLSLFFNNKFLPNKILLAENFFYLKKFKLAKKNYESIKPVGKIYSWYAAINLAIILENIEGEEYATSYLTKQFKKISKPNFENYYELANFFKDNKNYEKSIKYYSLALKKIEKNHPLIPKILERRGTSFERIGNWEEAERDLLESLKILPDQPYVLNYLAYSWVEKKLNIEKSLNMLLKANDLRKNDGYITDSVGWAYYMIGDYINAEKFLKKAVELMPFDPIINDHYADSLWMSKKEIQARYFWKHVLSLKEVEQKLIDKIEKKLIFGVI
mgnify:FL=1|tara:strand:+ start:3051 stop:4757 length:1707 start_codon:yes stop_codon:yes gene_type:complete